MTYTCRSGTHKWEKYHNHTGPPQGARAKNSTLGSPAQGSYIENQQGSCLGQPEFLWETDSTLLGYMH